MRKQGKNDENHEKESFFVKIASRRGSRIEMEPPWGIEQRRSMLLSQ
jgi:hypothetical protein